MSQKLIILVEDDLNLRQSMALILQRAGYLVTATDCVRKAIDLIQSRKYHLIITDINIPETRKVLLPKILEIYPYLSIVILTDPSSLESEGKDKLLSAHYLVKPVAPELLLDSVSTILGKRTNFNHNKNTNAQINRDRNYQ